MSDESKARMKRNRIIEEIKYQWACYKKNKNSLTDSDLVEELPKKECEHLPMWDAVGIVGPIVETFYKCKKCGAKLKATWSVADEQR